jgi:glycosyltransferase involved in cell wall biosynthesis
MRMLLRAAQQLDEDLDLLLYRPIDEQMAVDELVFASSLRDDFWRLWGVRIKRIHVVAQHALAINAKSLWQAYLRPALALRYQPKYAGLWGAGAVEGFRNAVAQSQPDLLLVHRLPSMGPVLQHRGALPPIAFDLDDVEHKAFKRLNELPPHWGAKRLMRLWLPPLVAGERRAIDKAACTFVCTPADAAELNGMFGTLRVHSIPNALPSPTASLLPNKPTLLFLGVYGYEPNRAAAEHLIANIWPLVLRQHPDARLFVAGKGCEHLQGFNAPPAGVEFLGFVDDLDALYAQTQVVACPILSGSGTRIKIIEAALRARPVVSTTIGAEGLELRMQNDEIVLADTAVDFAAAVSRLFHDPQAAVEIGLAARRKASTHYGELEVVKMLTDQLRALLPPGARSSRRSAGQG